VKTLIAKDRTAGLIGTVNPSDEITDLCVMRIHNYGKKPMCTKNGNQEVQNHDQKTRNHNHGNHGRETPLYREWQQKMKEPLSEWQQRKMKEPLAEWQAPTGIRNPLSEWQRTTTEKGSDGLENRETNMTMDLGVRCEKGGRKDPDLDPRRNHKDAAATHHEHLNEADNQTQPCEIYAHNLSIYSDQTRNPFFLARTGAAMASTGILNKKGFHMGLHHRPSRHGTTTRNVVTMNLLWWFGMAAADIPHHTIRNTDERNDRSLVNSHNPARADMMSTVAKTNAHPNRLTLTLCPSLNPAFLTQCRGNEDIHQWAVLLGLLANMAADSPLTKSPRAVPQPDRAAAPAQQGWQCPMVPTMGKTTAVLDTQPPISPFHKQHRDVEEAAKLQMDCPTHNPANWKSAQSQLKRDKELLSLRIEEVRADQGKNKHMNTQPDTMQWTHGHYTTHNNTCHKLHRTLHIMSATWGYLRLPPPILNPPL
jgi:hypothetical protein